MPCCLTELPRSKLSASRCNSFTPTSPGSIYAQRWDNQLKADFLSVNGRSRHPSWSKRGFSLCSERKVLGEVRWLSNSSFSPLRSSPWATLDPAHPRCLNPSPGDGGACSCRCGSKDGCVRWHKSSAAPAHHLPFQGIQKDLVWSFWAFFNMGKGKKKNPRGFHFSFHSKVEMTAVKYCL